MHSVSEETAPRSSRSGALSGRRSPPWATGFTGQAYRVLRDYLSEPNCVAVLAAFEARTGQSSEHLDPSHIRALCAPVESALDCFGVDEDQKSECLARLRFLEPVEPHGPAVRSTVTTIPIERDADVVRARLLGRQICRSLGFSVLDQTKVATVISELARNVLLHAGKGRVELRGADGMTPSIEVVARDDGPGIPDVEAVMSPSYPSRGGAGAGLRGIRRLMDHFKLTTQPGRGTTVTMRKFK